LLSNSRLRSSLRAGVAVGEALHQRQHEPDTNATTLVNVDALSGNARDDILVGQ
jgi:hypothetical protein